MSRPFLLACAAAAAFWLGAAPAAAQVALDRADPAYIEPTLPGARAAQPDAPAPPVRIEAERAPVAAPAVAVVATRIEIAGAEALSPADFDGVVEAYRGRTLDRDGMRALAGAVGAAARDRGYPFASASVRIKAGAPDTLVVDLDEGRISAVRLLGATNPAADRILQGLASGRPVTRVALERTLLLAGDVPGLRIVNSRLVRQDGFNLLFVDARHDPASAYLQVDNRGSDEVGPVRSTFLGSLRGVATAGDQLSLIVAQTPVDPKEFLFGRLRYDLPVDARGGIVILSGSAGRTDPGAALRRLDVIGHSYDLAIAYQRPLLRRRAGSLWANVELRAATSDQSLRGAPIRDDRLATLSGTLIGDATLAGGAIRGEAGFVWGLPLGGTTRAGDPLGSRVDGSARFVVGRAWADWTRTLSGPVSIRLAAEGQIASRPLLAAVEIGAGGPGFGRAFDYGERTGDRGILGSAELRLDLPVKTGGRPLGVQLYGFADGGHVSNLDGGFGGGTLVSAGGGVRLGIGRLNLGIEAAAPLNADRLDTGGRAPRLTVRTSIAF